MKLKKEQADSTATVTDPSYIYAEELLRAGLPILFCNLYATGQASKTELIAVVGAEGSKKKYTIKV